MVSFPKVDLAGVNLLASAATTTHKIVGLLFVAGGIVLRVLPGRLRGAPGSVTPHWPG